MKATFQPGAVKIFQHTVRPADLASFQSGNVHPVYATFALARDAEWACRLFVLDMKDDDEEGIGTMLQIDHKAPAFPNEEVTFKAVLESVKGNEIICSFSATVGERLIAEGRTGQRILRKQKLERIFSEINASGKHQKSEHE